MEAYNGTADELRATGRKVGDDLAAGAHDVKNIATGEIKNLIADVEDLLARITDLKDADVSRLRSKVSKAIEVAKDSLADGAGTLRRQAQRAAATTDDFVHDNPWQAIGVAALVGAVVGILATRRS